MTALGDALARAVLRMAEPEPKIRLDPNCKLEISHPEDPSVCVYCDRTLPHK